MDGLLGNLLGGLGGGGGQRGKGYKKTLKEADFFTADVTTVAGQYVLVGYYTVGAKQVVTVGQGGPNEDPMLQGRVKLDAEAAAAGGAVEGWFKITHESAQGTRTEKILEERTDELRQATRSERLCLPRADMMGFTPVGEDSKIGVYFKADAAATLGYDAAAPETEFLLPITIWE